MDKQVVSKKTAELDAYFECLMLKVDFLDFQCYSKHGYYCAVNRGKMWGCSPIGVGTATLALSSAIENLGNGDSV